MNSIPLLDLSCARRLLGVAGLVLGLAAPAVFAQLYSENFDDGVANNWSVVSGTWAVSTGTDKTYDSTSTGAGPEISLYVGANYGTDYTYSAKVTRWGSGWNNQVGLVYFYKDASNYYRVGFGGTTDSNGKNIHLWQRVAGVETEVATGTFPVGTPSPMTVDIVRTGNQTQIKVAGTVYVTLNQTALTGSGRIGAFDVNAAGKFNDIVVTDHVPPTATMTAPANNATVSGNVTVSASASDNVGVANVQFLLDGANLQTPDTTAPYSITWDSSLATPGTHTLSARATDTSGNTATATNPVTVTVQAALPPGWSASDIGSTGAAGSTSYSNGTYIIDGAGTNIWGTTDEFHFARQSISGDCTVIARVASVESIPGAPWSKAGIMIRESTAPTSKYVLLALTPDRGLLFEARTSDVAPNNNSIQMATQSSLLPPKWLRLIRTGGSFSAAYSTDGVTWTTAGMAQSTVTVSMATSALAGLEVCSTVHGTLCTGTFDNVSVTANTNYSPPFPRLGIYAIGGTGSGGQAYGTETQSMLSKFNLVVIAGSYEGWATGRGYSREQVVTSIKNQSVVGTKVFQYVILESVTSTPQLPTWDARAGQNGWYLLDPSTGQRVVTSYPAYQVNMTQWAPSDPGPGNLRPFAWGAQLVYDLFVDPAGSYGVSDLAAPSLDGMYLDNVFPYAKTTGDWDRDMIVGDSDDFGFSDYNNYGLNAASWWRAGQLDYFTKIRQLMPGKLQMGNNAEFFNIARPAMTDLSKIGVLNQLLNGGILEPAIGAPSAPETWGSPNYTGTILSAYRYNMDALLPPKLCIFESRVAMNGSDTIDATAYRASRYGLAVCLMNDGYWDPNNTQSPNTHLNADTRWFDEMSVYNGVGQSLTSANVYAGLGYLGQPIDTPPTQPRWPTKGTYGVWAREFTGGIVLMNPRGNGPQNVTVTDLGGSGVYKRISGTQAPTINTGADVTATISLADRDAIILLRK